MLTLEYARGRGAFHQHWHLAVGSWALVAVAEALLHNVTALATPFLSLITIPLFCSTFFPSLLLSSLFSLCGLIDAARPLAEFTAKLATEAVIVIFQMVNILPTLWIVPRWSVVAGAGFAAILLIFSNSRAARAWSVLITAIAGLVIGLLKEAPPTRSALKVEQLDVGQGDAALVYTESGAGLVDSGPLRALSDSSWIRLFAAREITHLEWSFLTHQDEDHAGGLKKLQLLMPVGASRPPFPVLGPPRRAKASQRNRKMWSIFVPLSDGGFYLSAGDSSARDELRAGAWAKDLASKTPEHSTRILKVSHHGSRFSTLKEFLDLVRPNEAWISSGAGNTYGHPTSRVLELLSREGIPIHRTDRNGNIVWENEEIRARADRRRSPSHPP